MKIKNNNKFENMKNVKVKKNNILKRLKHKSKQK